MAALLHWCEIKNLPLWERAFQQEGESLAAHLKVCWAAMRQSLDRSLNTEGTLPGGQRLKRKARAMLARARDIRATTVSA